MEKHSLSMKKITLFSTLILFFFPFTNSFSKFSKPQSKKETNSKVETASKVKEETVVCLEITNHFKSHKKHKNQYKYSSVRGKSKRALQKNCYSFYSKYWQKDIAGHDNTTEEYIRENIDKWKKIIKNPALDVKIKSIKNNIAVVSRSSISHCFEMLEVEDLWVYRSNRWEIILGFEHNVGYSVKFLHLNRDKYIDAVVTGGCCDTTIVDILIGDKKKVLILRQSIYVTGEGGFEYKGRCNSRFDVKPAEAMVKEYGSRPKLAIFDCRKNRYVLKQIKK